MACRESRKVNVKSAMLDSARLPHDIIGKTRKNKNLEYSVYGCGTSELDDIDAHYER